MKKTFKYIIILIITCILSLFIYNNHEYIFNKLYNIERIDTVYTTKTDTIFETDTFFKEKPIPKYIYKVKTDTVYDKEWNEIKLDFENKIYQDTLLCEKDTAEVQIFTSGIKSNVDSINLKLRKSNYIQTNTVTIEKYIVRKRKLIDHFKIGIGVGYGIGLKNKELEPFVGVSLNYNF